ncbi:MAG: radical SAM protein [Candidatus Omnitrophica bacterium]|nr:radical SAM protein [Candidatus Omnitrophota bacterium]MBU2265641.1 radical SAM protein [Candidatus Omnitrophota bacterium]
MALITSFDPWRNKLCSCPAKYSLSAYTGCNHGCLYCYASSYIKDFGRPREKKDFLKILSREIKKIPPGSIITIANSSDPYLNLEKKIKLTRQALEILKNYDLKINLVTKSSLVLRDLDLLKNMKKILIAISLTCLDQKLARKLEPRTPSPQERLKTLKSLSAYLPVVVRLDPLVYPLNTENLESLIKQIKSSGAKQIITSTYKIKPDNFKRMVSTFRQHQNLWQALYLEKGERKNNYIYLPEKLRKDLISRVKKLALAENLGFSSCREGFNQLNTALCDGSSFF